MEPNTDTTSKGKEEQLAATQRVCQVCIRNQFGDHLKNISLRHRMHNRSPGEEFIKLPELQGGGTSTPQTIHYMTGIDSGYDYWYIRFECKDSGEAYDCKDNFWCNITSSDENELITVTLRNAQMEIKMPSGGDYVSLNKIERLAIGRLS